MMRSKGQLTLLRQSLLVFMHFYPIARTSYTGVVVLAYCHRACNNTLFVFRRNLLDPIPDIFANSPNNDPYVKGRKKKSFVFLMTRTFCGEQKIGSSLTHLP